MPSAFDQLKASPKKVKIINSAYDSESFDADGTIHVDGLVGSATISPSGRDVALASPEGLAIIDLDSPYSPPRRLSSHGLPWLVVDVQWSPFAFRDYWVASTANHRCLVWNLNLRDDSTSGAIEHSLQGHSRAITDINFSAHHPDLLATCAVDGYVHCWDLRRPRQPALTFCDWFAGATQVKYSRQDPFIIASSHDRWLHIWDERKSSEPLRSISAHTSKIYGIDWNRFIATSIVTCSLDKSIKFWDYSKGEDVPERVIRTDFPVWRARHTPFGSGLLAMPQNEPGHLYLFDRRTQPDTPKDGPVEPVATFEGHGDHKAKEFLWRSRGNIDDGIDNREFQLVSWGEDNKLRLARPDPSVLESIGYVKGMEARKNLVITRKGATYKTFRTVDDGNHHRRTATMSDPRTGGIRQSALTQGMKIQPSRTGPSWRGPSMKAKNAGTGKVDRSQAQMNWMRGITMTKRKSGTNSPQRAASKDSAMFGLGFHDDHWGEPESLQEEFVRISTQLPNVKWDSIDMDTLILNASLKGPWGVDRDEIFIKVKVDIPHAYPKTKAPKFIIDKNAFMPAGTHEKLENEVHQIAQQHLKRKQNCLAAAFSYLLGEADLTQSTTFFKNVRDLDDEMDVLGDESSSEDSDIDIPAGASASMSMSQELSASTEIGNPLAPSNRPAIPPVIRTAGARFSNDGRLVCFFPTKDAKLFTPNDTIKERPKDQPTFAGFGRLTQDSPPPRHRNFDGEASTDVLSALSDDSDDSSSSSESDLTTMHKISLWYRPGRGLHKTWSANGSLRSSAAGTGPGTGTGTGTSRRRPGRPKNIISMHNMQNILPSKKQFAEEYSIFGDGAQVCEHNAQVAEKHGDYDLVNIWRYSALLLRSDIPLELHEHCQKNRSVLVIAKDVLSRYRGNDSRENEGELRGRVKWGHHPLAQEFVSDLFDYFERIADVQMLAMLSCIFGESSTEHSVPYAESHLTQPETPLAMKAPSFSLEYFPTDAAEWSLERRSGYSSAVTTPGTVHTPVIFSDTDSPDVLWMGDPGSQSYSTGETPPPRSFRDQLSDIDPTQSISTSPNDRSIRRSQSALASALTLNSSRGFTSIASSSPPGRKRPSPAERILENISHIQGNITWGGSTYFGAPSELTDTARTSISDDEFRRDDLVSMIPMSVTVKVEDETAFDDDGWLATPLLDPSRHPNYASYRYAYAEMLQMWRLPLTRLEIMKFNVLKEDSMEQLRRTSAGSSYHESANHDTSQSGTGTTSPTIMLGGKREQLQALQASGRGLDVTGICRIHEIQLQPLQYSQTPSLGGAVGVCERCRRTQSQLTCVLCREPINALYPACLGCGCVFHKGCIAEWHAMGETECPAGDDCECVDEADRGQVETWIALRAAMGLERKTSGRAKTSHGEKNNSNNNSSSNGRNRSGSGSTHTAKPTLGSNSFSSATSIANRLRRRSAPAPFLLPAEEDDDETPLVSSPQPGTPTNPSARFRVVRSPPDQEDDNSINNKNDLLEGVSSSPALHYTSSAATPTRPSPLGPGVSAARVSLGNRLKSLEAQRPGLPHRRSGGSAGGGNGKMGGY
ncbi:hypothetical protein VMCG_02111 [Cytospora schulzeri]|uniref:RING-type domain-containing protein n=1 Tax=Cytospora schulzeri TaxID=448051 RepID=A0A423X2W4_9PEZI|nr:hypothetical protein VMCG_02111 [Valsa malicola]